MKRKKQHIIPYSYLRSWCDPDTPIGQEPYVWIISVDGTTERKKSPRKIFTEADMYTIKFPDGERELVIEDTLSKVEDAFARVGTKKN